MINILQDGFSNFQNHFWIIFFILLIVIWGQIVMQKILFKIFDNQFTAEEYLALSLSGWVFSVFLWAGIYFLITILFGKIIANIISIIIFFIPFLFIKFKKTSITVFSLFSFLLFSLFLRLAFLEQAIFPSYFDSAEHYRVIQYFLNIYQNESLPANWFLTNYYHAGYHFLSASLIQLFQFNEINFMLVFGQIVLTLLPTSLFFLLKQLTQSNTVAFFTCLIAGFGFHMPAHLINWGKYPALLSLVGFQFIFCLSYIFIKNNLTRTQKSKLYWLIGLSILVTALIHTRTLVIFLLLAASLLIAYQIKKLSIRSQYFSSIFLFIIFGIEIYYIAQSPALSPLVTGYTQRDLWSLILVLLLIPFSIKSFPNLVCFLLSTLCLSIFFLFLPISLFDYGTQTLLDRPFVQMLTYFPLSITAGLGIAGLMSIIKKIPYLNFFINLSLFIFIALNANLNYNFYPSDCCQLVSRDDLSAIDWIDKTLSLDAEILIASSRLYVTSYEPTQTQAGVDAGIWITPLTSRKTFTFAEINLSTTETYTEICNQDLEYIYVASTPQSFKRSELSSHPNWYRQIFMLPNAQIYQIIGCK